MTIWEECAVYVAEPMEEDEARGISRECRQTAREMRMHDRDGFLAEYAGNPECVALGHVPDPEVGWDEDEDAHPMGWDGTICIATRHGSACTWCESGECETPPIDRAAFWALFATANA